MSSSAKTALALLLLVFMATQACQVFPALQIGWPFSPYTLFRFFGTENTPHVSIGLLEDDGSVQYVRPGNIFPVEFFSAYDMVRQNFSEKQSKEQKDLLAGMILKRLNQEMHQDRWPHIQGVYPPARALSGSKLVGFSVCSSTFNFEAETAQEPPTIISSLCPYSYRLSEYR